MPYWASAPYGDCHDENEYSIMSVEAKDPQFMKQITAYKAYNPNLKVVLSVGGWNFPSEYFSRMAASTAARAKFVSSAKAFLAAHNLDGIDLDWEYPCSPARSDPVKISCQKFRNTDDKGGSCPQDSDNLLLLAKDLRAGLGNSTYISIASQAGEANWKHMNLKAVTPFIDHWHVMSYDYTVSDVPGGEAMSPNAPLYNPASPAEQMSISYSIDGYMAEGVPPSKMMLGIPFYGHSWFKPAMPSWQSFGANGSVQGECCGPFGQTYGAKPGKGSQLCGTYMYNELQAAGGERFYDDTSKSDIAYFSSAGSDGYTEAGTWVSFNDKKSIAAITAYAKNKSLAGVFIFDTSMDTIKDGAWTFELSHQIADDCHSVKPSPPSPTPPSPAPGPSPSPPTPAGCPGGSLTACMALCPSDPPAAYKACAAQCAKRCLP